MTTVLRPYPRTGLSVLTALGLLAACFIGEAAPRSAAPVAPKSWTTLPINILPPPVVQPPPPTNSVSPIILPPILSPPTLSNIVTAPPPATTPSNSPPVISPPDLTPPGATNPPVVAPPPPPPPPPPVDLPPVVATGVKRTFTHAKSQRWNDPGNWDPVGLPQNGDDLYFYDKVYLEGPDTMINDMINLTVNSLTFYVDTSDGFRDVVDWELDGWPLGLLTKIEVSGGVSLHITSDIRMGAEGTGVHFLVSEGKYGAQLHLSGQVTLNGNNLHVRNYSVSSDAIVEISGIIAGTGHLIFDAGLGEISGIDSNTGIFDLVVTQGGSPNGAIVGTALLNKQAGWAVTYDVRVDGGGQLLFGRSNQLPPSANLVVAGTGLSSIGGNLPSKVLLGGYSQTVASLSFANTTFDNPNQVTSVPVVDTQGGLLTIAGNLTCSTDPTLAAPELSGSISFPTGSHKIAVDDNISDAPNDPSPGLRITAQISGPGALVKDGQGAVALSGANSFSGGLTVLKGRVDVAHPHALGAGPVQLDSPWTLALENVVVDGVTLQVGDSPNPAVLGSAFLIAAGAAAWTGPVVLNDGLNVSGENLKLQGPISGGGAFTVSNSGTVEIAGPDVNTFTGKTTALGSLLLLNKPGGVRALSGPLQVGADSGAVAVSVNEVRWMNSNQGYGSPVSVGPGGLLNLNNFTEAVGPITFHFGGHIQTGSGTLSTIPPLTVQGVGQSATAVIDGNLALLPPPPIVTGTKTAQLASKLPPIDANPQVFDFSVDHASTPSGCDLLINAVISGTAERLIKNGPGVMCLTAQNVFSAGSTINEGSIRLQNAVLPGQVQVNTGARLEGAGVVGDVGSSGGVTAPGVGGRSLACVTFNTGVLGNGVLEVQLNGTQPGVQYSQLEVERLANLSGITLNATLGFTPPLNSDYTILKSDSKTAVVGTFNGLPEGATLNVGAMPFKISYHGGAGYDVVLTPDVSVSVTPAGPPALSVKPGRGGKGLHLNWPTSDPSWGLESTIDVGSNVWLPVTIQPSDMDPDGVQIDTQAGPLRFYRLAKH